MIAFTDFHKIVPCFYSFSIYITDNFLGSKKIFVLSLCPQIFLFMQLTGINITNTRTLDKDSSKLSIKKMQKHQAKKKKIVKKWANSKISTKKWAKTTCDKYKYTY